MRIQPSAHRRFMAHGIESTEEGALNGSVAFRARPGGKSRPRARPSHGEQNESIVPPEPADRSSALTRNNFWDFKLLCPTIGVPIRMLPASYWGLGMGRRT